MSLRLLRVCGVVSVLLVLIAASPMPAFGQAGRLSGRVKDARTGDAIKGATIVAENTSAMPGSFTSVSDEKGRFSMLGLRGGTWFLTITAPGYFPLQGATRVGSFGSGPSVDLTLTKAPTAAANPLATVDVQALRQDLVTADTLMDRGQYDEAIAAYEAILVKVPALTSVNIEIGRAYRAKSDYGRAADAYRRALEKDPANETAQVMLGQTQFDLGDADAGERTLRTAAERPGAGALAFNAMGALMRERRDPVDAARWFDKAVKAEPTWPAPLLALGQIALDRGDSAMATSLLERVVALDGDGPDAARAKALLKR
jgi:Flp pilus assembly protein TadD